MQKGLSQVFLLYRRSLIGTALKIVRDRQTAEDLAQEAFIRAHKAAEIGSIRNLGAFLHRIARNLALDYERRRQVRERFEDRYASQNEIAAVPADSANAEETLMEKERFHQFDKALQSLPARAKRAWKLSQIDGWTYDQIAGHLGVSKNTVYNDVKLVMGHCHDVLKRLD